MANNQVEIEIVKNQVEPGLVDVSTTGFFLTTLSMANETDEVTYDAHD